MKIKATPYQKKQLSYDKDRRNTVGESGGKAHKAVRKRKTNANRALRRAQSVNDGRALKAKDIDSFDQFVARIKGRSWQKTADMPLRQYIELRTKQRAE